MKKILYVLVALFAINSLLTALAPVTVVVRDDGSNLSVKLVNTRSGVEYYSGEVDEASENGSGYATFVIGEGDPDWGDVPKSIATNASVVLNIYNNGILIEQQRIDKLVQESARSAQLPSNVNVSNNFSAGGNIQAGGNLVVKDTLIVEGPSNFGGNVEVTGNINVGGVLTYSSATASGNEFTDDVDVEEVIANILIYVGGTDTTVTINAENDLNPNLPNNATYTFIHSYENDDYLDLIIKDSFDNTIYLYFGQSITLFKINGKFYIQQPSYGQGG